MKILPENSEPFHPEANELSTLSNVSHLHTMLPSIKVSVNGHLWVNAHLTPCIGNYQTEDLVIN